MYATQGHFPFWLAIWGAVLADAGAAAPCPQPVTLLRKRTEAGLAARGARAPRSRAPRRRLAGRRGSPRSAQEAARVRALIEQRGGTDDARACSPRWTASSS